MNSQQGMSAMSFPARLFIVVFTTVLGMAAGHWLERTTLLRHIAESGYKAAQEVLSQTPHPTDGVALVDLSLLVPPRAHQEETPEKPGDPEVENQMIGQFTLLEQVLKEIRTANPRCVFVDWELVLPEAYRLPDKTKFRFAPAVSQEFQRAYGRLFETIANFRGERQVMVVGDQVERTKAEGFVVLPFNLGEHVLVSAGLGYLEGVDWRTTREAPRLSPVQPLAGKRLPSFTDAVISHFDEPDLVREQPRRWLLFSATRLVHNERCFWIDYGYAQDLLDKSVRWSFRDTINDDIRKKLRGKVVILLDLQRPVRTDDKEIPVKTRHQYGAGIGHACAYLTRTRQPLYALPEGWPEWVLFGGSGVILSLGTSFFSGWASRPFRKSRRLRVAVAVELLGLVGILIAAVIWAPRFLASQHLLVPQLSTFVALRSLDLIGVIVFLAIEAFGDHE